MAEPTVGRALRASLGAVWRERWLAPAGLGVALLRGALLFPAFLFVSAVAARAGRHGLAAGGGPRGAGAWALAALTSPRVLAVGAGLWLAGWLLWGALRAAWIAGALPVLAARIAGVPDRPGLPSGAAWRFGPVAVAAAAGALLDLAGQGLLAATALGAWALLPRAQGSLHPGAVATVVAGAATAAAFLALALSVLGDAAVARAAASGEGPGAALSGALSRVLTRPAAFVATALGVALAGALAVSALEGTAGMVLGLVRRAPGFLVAVPEGLVHLAGALVAAAVELWRLAALAVLALGGAPAPLSPRAAPPPEPRPAAAPSR